VTLATVASAASSLAPLNPAIVIVTLDAWRDTASTLQGLLPRWGMPSSASLLSGDPAAVGDVLDAFNVARIRNEKTGDIDHVAIVYVIDPQGRIAYALAAPTTDWVVEAARRSVSALPAGSGG
jgi:cytochrome oxidase Cu insertion factor (SCO1/SenC/PrrC family)